jgi:hypothetical protein
VDDFQFSISLLEDFFAQKKIQHSLATIAYEEISGWEVWLQVEFATFLSLTYGDDLEWKRERQILIDKRKNKNRTRLAADFVFRRKGYAIDRYIVLEFKQHTSPKSCFSNMMKDAEKIRCAKASEIDMRAFWVVGIHPKSSMSKAEIKDYVCNISIVDRDFVVTKFIPNTNFAFTIF